MTDKTEKSKKRALEDGQPDKKEKKAKKEKSDAPEFGPEDLSPIAQPLAQKKLAKKVYRTVKKASKHRQIKRGIKEVTKSLRKSGKGVVILAGDISPMDVLSHLPILCEDAACPYLFVPSKESLGQASATKRPTSCIMMIMESDPAKLKGNKKAIEILQAAKSDPEKAKDLEEYQDAFQEIFKEAKSLVRPGPHRPLIKLTGQNDSLAVPSV